MTQLSNRFESEGTNTMQKFEKLIKETQQADEGILLRHIQRNLEHLEKAGDFQTRFS